MCITFLFTNNSKDTNFKYKLILINNRDEFYSRKTLNAAIYYDNQLIQIYGTDIETKIKGTWLAISKHNDVIRIGNLLNVPGEMIKGRKEELKGRGPIALEYVQTNEDIETHNKKLCDVCTEYNSFNFLSVEIKSSDIKTFFSSSSTQNYEKLEIGCVNGFSNSPVHVPLQKVIVGKEKFAEIIQNYTDKDKMIEALQNLLKWEEKHYPDEELSRRRGLDAEDFSSIHVRHNQFYGTRTRTIILIDQDNNIDYIEDTMINQDPENAIWEMTKLKM